MERINIVIIIIILARSLLGLGSSVGQSVRKALRKLVLEADVLNMWTLNEDIWETEALLTFLFTDTVIQGPAGTAGSAGMKRRWACHPTERETWRELVSTSHPGAHTRRTQQPEHALSPTSGRESEIADVADWLPGLCPSQQGGRRQLCKV